MKNKKMIITICAILIMLIISLLFYAYQLSGMNDDKQNTVVIKQGSIVSIAKYLEEEGYIKSTNAFKIYMFTQSNKNLKAGTYELSKNMGVAKIVKILQKGSDINPDEVSITFKEGINIRKVASIISENTNNNYDDIINLISNKEYINNLISKYWFLTEEVLDGNIYYPLEGYLFPNTYRFKNKDVKAEEIIETMLDEMDKKLLPLKDEITSSNLSVHKLITMASIVELEGKNTNDRNDVAGVFYNRLASGWNLGSDVTAYYANKIDDFSISLNSENGLYNCNNKYNTRCENFKSLPIGPITNPGLTSIESAITPSKHDYYYFVADCSGKTYFNKDDAGHINTINKLKQENNWCA